MPSDFLRAVAHMGYLKARSDIAPPKAEGAPGCQWVRNDGRAGRRAVGISLLWWDGFGGAGAAIAGSYLG